MTEQRISTPNAVALMTVAGLIDLVSFLLGLIPFIGWIFDILVDFVALLIFGIWFAHLGISILKKHPGSLLVTFIIKLIPILELLPDWSFFVFKIIAENRLSFRATPSGDESRKGTV